MHNISDIRWVKFRELPALYARLGNRLNALLCAWTRCLVALIAFRNFTQTRLLRANQLDILPKNQICRRPLGSIQRPLARTKQPVRGEATNQAEGATIDT